MIGQKKKNEVPFTRRKGDAVGESERKSLRGDCIEKGNRQLLSEWDDKKDEGLILFPD